MHTVRRTMVSVPFPSQWGFHAGVAGNPRIMGTLTINTVYNNRISGSIYVNGSVIPITGYWNENMKEVQFQLPFSTYSGNLTIFDDAATRTRHYVLNGQFSGVGLYGTGNWIATTSTILTDPPIHNQTYPPVGVFLTSEIQ